VIDAPNDDPELLSAVAAGDVAAVRRLIDEIGPIIYGFVHARVGGRPEAEDIVQDVFLEAVRSRDSFRGDAALSTWMCAIARRRLARYYEQERKAAVVQSRLRAVGESPPAPGADDATVGRDELVRALGTLPPAQRQVLVLKYLDDRPVDDVASELGRTSVQVQSLLQRARAGMRRALSAVPGGDDA